MNPVRLIILAVCFCGSVLQLYAQDSTRRAYVFGDGLTLYGGIGYFAVRDEFISSEKYSGTMPLFAASWSRLHETYGYRVQCEYQFTSRLKNYNVSAELTQFLLALDFLYPLGNTQLMSKDLFFYLGPTAETFVHFRRQNIAGSGGAIMNAYSALVLLSGGARSEAYCPLTSAIQLEATAQLSLVSLGGRMVNPNKSDKSFFRFLTTFNGFNGWGGATIRYKFSSSSSVAVGYRLAVTSVSAWDYLLSSYDSFIGSVSYDF